MNEEAIAYWSQHGTVPSPTAQQATVAELQAEIASLKAQVVELQAKPARMQRSAPPPTVMAEDEQETSYGVKAINARAMETTTRLLALPELMELSREEIYDVVEAYQRGLTTSRGIREALKLRTPEYNRVLKPVVAALKTYGSDVSALPRTDNIVGNGSKKATATRGNVVSAPKSLTATRQRKAATV